MARAELLGELQMASMIGDGSTNFDDMPFLVIIEENRVEVSLLSFRQPLRMTRAEQLALLTAAGALVDPAGDPRDPLARALHKLAAQYLVERALQLPAIDLRWRNKVTRVTPGETFEVDLDHDGGPLARALDDAVGARRRVRFTYWTFGRDAVGERSVEPWRVFSRDDEWYLVGLDVDRGGTRHFRLDRIHDLVVTDEVGAAPPRSVAASIELDDELPTVELDLPASASWVVVSRPGGPPRGRPVAGDPRGDRSELARAGAAARRPRGPHRPDRRPPRRPGPGHRGGRTHPGPLPLNASSVPSGAVVGPGVAR